MFREGGKEYGACRARAEKSDKLSEKGRAGAETGGPCRALVTNHDGSADVAAESRYCCAANAFSG